MFYITIESPVFFASIDLLASFRNIYAPLKEFCETASNCNHHTTSLVNRDIIFPHCGRYERTSQVRKKSHNISVCTLTYHHRDRQYCYNTYNRRSIRLSRAWINPIYRTYFSVREVRFIDNSIILTKLLLI